MTCGGICTLTVLFSNRFLDLLIAPLVFIFVSLVCKISVAICMLLRESDTSVNLPCVYALVRLICIAIYVFKFLSICFPLYPCPSVLTVLCIFCSSVLSAPVPLGLLFLCFTSSALLFLNSSKPTVLLCTYCISDPFYQCPSVPRLLALLFPVPTVPLFFSLPFLCTYSSPVPLCPCSLVPVSPLFLYT